MSEISPGQQPAPESLWQPDILGTGYTQRVLDLGADPDGEGGGALESVLVRRAPREGEAAHGAVLYVHGFADYFFQEELADFFGARGLAFYALDLRKCGRSLRPGQTAHYVSDLAVYDQELDQALAVITEAHPGQPVIAVAHSTGGLVLPLWLDRRRRRAGADGVAAGPVTVAAPTTSSDPAMAADPVAAVVLNSPWLDLQGGWLLRGPLTQLIRLLAKARPFQAMKMKPGVYGQTVHVSGTGEWQFDTSLKPLDGFPVTFGWITAIRRGHTRVHRGLGLDVPVLVLRSDKSGTATVYSPECDRCDLVLDTRQIGHWARHLGRQVTDVPVQDARHDVFLSLPEVRARAYAALATWLDGTGIIPLSDDRRSEAS